LPPTPNDVSDRESREEFLRRGAFDALAALRADTPAEWGRMTAQQMVEHLAWVFEISTGRARVECPVPEEKRERYKPFLYDNRPTPREFVNTALVDGLPALRHADLATAIDALRGEVRLFFDHAAEEPDARFAHPVFGPIAAEEWSRSHFKHVRHHLLQFRLIDE
jgi:oxepin-CoA hydrolase / 3-oxo-5,6-dehydrosuberyl-CoA semialdehyde dehydrogenase